MKRMKRHETGTQLRFWGFAATPSEIFNVYFETYYSGDYQPGERGEARMQG